MKQRLMESARELEQPTEKAFGEFHSKMDLIGAELARRMSDRDDIEKLVGPGNVEMMKDNSRNMARFLDSLFSKYDYQVLVETVLWVFRSYRSHGFNLSFWPANLDTMVEVCRDELSPETFREVYPYLHWMIVNIPAFSDLTD